MSDVVSIVIPAYNEAVRFTTSLPRLRAAFERDPGIEVIIVDDGSTDTTADVVAAQFGGWGAAKLVRLPWNGGKGAAVKAGVAVARGDITCFMDADLSADLDDFPRLIRALDGADIALGSRSIAGSNAVYENTMRRVTSKVFNAAVCGVARVIASDTQCGFKAFRTPVAKLLFHLSEVEGFAFDVEVLALAQLLGYRIVEVPVAWVEAEGSKVRPLDPARMLFDVIKTRRRCDRAERARRRGPGTAAPNTFAVTEFATPGLDLRGRTGVFAVHPVDPADADVRTTIGAGDDDVIDLTVADRAFAEAARVALSPRKPLAGVVSTAPARLRMHKPPDEAETG